MKKMHKIYAKFTTLNIFTIEDFLRKKHMHLDCMEIGWIARRLPMHWLQIIPTMDLQQTLWGNHPSGMVNQSHLLLFQKQQQL